MEITKADKAIFAIKKKNREAVLKLLDALKDEENISVHLLPDIYPMGEERAVVRECLGVNLDTTQLPSAARSVVINLETVAKIAEAIEEKKPCISKNVTVRGNICLLYTSRISLRLRKNWKYGCLSEIQKKSVCRQKVRHCIVMLVRW